MLVLDRKIGESITIVGDIVVKVLSIERRRVKLGISAPRGVKVLRTELLDRREYDRPR